MDEVMFFDKDCEDVVDYDTACDRVYNDTQWDDLERIFMNGMRSGKFCISEFWNRLPEWMQIDIGDDAFNELFDMRFKEVEEDEENA